MLLPGLSPSASAAVEPSAGDLLAVLLGGLTYFVVNQVLVTAAVALEVGRCWWQLLREDLAYEGSRTAPCSPCRR